ncbi:MAG TPA: acyltransferase family protein [Lachnospiraceae bacterium]|nr:acyltransferase family protein [Lachnospiraceae bacterium]
METKTRLDYFDMAKGIGMILVLLGHLQGDAIFSYSPYILPLCTWIFSFHMPLFFIISGMLMNYKHDLQKDMAVLCKKRFRGIMIPYFWFSLFYISVVFYALFFGGSIAPETLYVNLWYIFSMYGMNVLWFLPALFFGELLFLFLTKKLGTKKSIAAIVILTILASAASCWLQTLHYETPLQERLHEFSLVLLRPILACTFICIGYYVFYLFKERERFCMKELLLGILFLGIGIAFTHVNHGVDFRSLVQKNLFFYYLCALSGSFGLILVCKNIKPLGLIKFWGINSLAFMAIHNNKTILYSGMQCAMYLNQYITRARGYISYITVILIILIYVTLMIWIINRFFGFIVGKPSPVTDLLLKKK